MLDTNSAGSVIRCACARVAFTRNYHRGMRRLLALTALALVAAGCSTPADTTPTVTSTPAAKTTTTDSATAAPTGPPPLEATARQFVADSNNTIGQNYTTVLEQYATPECAQLMLGLGDTNTSQPTRLVDVNQTGTTGTTITALRDDPAATGSTLHWTYTTSWKFTCEGIFG